MSWITFVKIKVIGDYFSYFYFCTENSFLCKNENKRNNLSNDFNLNVCYPKHDSKQYLKDFTGHLA